MPSPFTPYLGMVPKAFIGRDKEIEQFRKNMKDAQSNKPSSLLLIGNRGLGKTVLLKYLASIAKMAGFYSIYISLDESSNTPATLANRIYGRVKAVMEDEIISLKARKFLKKSGPKITVKLEDLELQLSSCPNEEEVNENNFVLVLGKLIKTRRICLFTDETQSALGTGVARFLVNLLYAELPEYASSWITILAGTPLLEQKILEATPADRAFAKMRLTYLTKDQVKEVLQKTTSGTGVNFSSSAGSLIAEDTYGMPYYIQFFGDQLFNLSGGKAVSKRLYLNKRGQIIDNLGKTVFDTRLAEIERRGLYYKVLAQFALLDTDEGVSVNEATRDLPTYGGPYVRELEAKGYLTRIKRGKYRISDKLFRDWICKLR
jgi:hypothetical protein